jgi:thiamine kinase-like enzyme
MVETVMDDQGIGLAREALKRIQLFWSLDDTEIEVKRLGGLTNLVFFVNLHGEQYVLRIPGRGTEEYINRQNEAQAAREAAKAKVSPDVLHFDEVTGVMVTRFIDQGVTMSWRISSPAGSPRRAGEVFTAHHPGRQLPFELFAMTHYLDSGDEGYFPMVQKS